ncbi:MAG: hypothetical protein R3F61_23650 [Myxococcota bacterium]
MVHHLNTLPTPIDAACIVRSLERPLSVEATVNPFSAQPADGTRSPRIFLFSDTLSISLVATGVGADVVELGEATGDVQSLKGELALPIEASVAPSAPHDRIVDPTEGVEGTVCRACHDDEAPWPDAPGEAFASVAIRPDRDSLLDLDLLAELADGCDPTVEPERCAFMDALFAGEVEHQPFPERFPTIFELGADP